MALFGKKQKEEKEPKKTEEKSVDEQAALPASPSLPKGGDASAYEVVLSPHVSEKGTIAGEQNKYIFRIAGSANKLDAKKAVESLYKVEVAKVRVSYVRSKVRRVGRHEGHKPGFKKAMVTLKEGSKIDLAA